MANPPKPIFVDWNLIKIWCCDNFFTVQEISKHSEEVHSDKENVNIHTKSQDNKINFNEKPLPSDNNNHKATFSCDLCEKDFKHGSSLWNHKRYIHEGIKGKGHVHSCNLCEYKTPHKYSLKIHKDRHKGIRYSCDICEDTFSDKWSLKVHKDSRHQGIVYACKICEFKSPQKYNLKVHIENKHQGIRHYCEACDFQATTRSILTQHKKRHLPVGSKPEYVATTPQNLNDSWKAQPSPKKKRKLYDSNVEKLLLCEPEECPREKFFSPSQKKRKNSHVNENVVATPQKDHANTEKNVKVKLDDKINSEDPLESREAFVDAEDVPNEIPGYVEFTKTDVGSFVATPLKHDVNTENNVDNNINIEVPIESKGAFVETAVEVQENCVKVPGWRILPQYLPLSTDPGAELDEATILKYHLKQEHSEKIEEKRDAQWLKRQEDIKKLNNYWDRIKPTVSMSMD